MSSLSRPRETQAHSDISDFHHGHECESSPKLRPDNVGSVAHIRRATPERGSVGSDTGSSKMIITRATEWDIKRDENSRGGSLGSEGEWGVESLHYAV